MTPEQGQPFELLFLVMVFGPGVLLAVIAAIFRRSWILWGLGGVLATLVTLLLADQIGASLWAALSERGYSGSFVAAARAIAAVGMVTLTMLILMALTRRKPVVETPARQEPLTPGAHPGVGGGAELTRVPADVFAALVANEQLEPVLEAGVEGDRIRVQRRGGGILGHLPRLQGMEVAMLARRGGRLKMWVADRQANAPVEPGVVQVAYEESARGSSVSVEPLEPSGAPPLPPSAFQPERNAQPQGRPLIAAGGGTVVALPRAGGPVSAPQARSDVASQLATLASLRASGALTEAEFDAAKRKVLQG